MPGAAHHHLLLLLLNPHLLRLLHQGLTLLLLLAAPLHHLGQAARALAQEGAGQGTAGVAPTGPLLLRVAAHLRHRLPLTLLL